jgi:hypothetical protein
MRIEAAKSVLVTGITKCPKRKKKRSAPVVPQRAVKLSRTVKALKPYYLSLLQM